MGPLTELKVKLVVTPSGPVTDARLPNGALDVTCVVRLSPEASTLTTVGNWPFASKRCYRSGTPSIWATYIASPE
jgi:hypothetical protein